jgi:hypothetical protein
LGLIRLEFGIFEDEIVVMAESVVRMPQAGKPKLLDQVLGDGAVNAALLKS